MMTFPDPEIFEDGEGYAFRNLSPDETSFSVAKSKFRVKHPPTPTCHLTVWLEKVFTPEGGSPVKTPFETYTWSGTGNPCFNDPDLTPFSEENLIYSPVYEIDEPETDGTIFISVKKFSYLPDYIPPDDGSANGYPSLL